MTCVYEQLLEGVFDAEWYVHRFKDPLEVYDAPEIVLSDLVAGEVNRTAGLFVNGDDLIRRHGARVDYDVLAVESRWLLLQNQLFDNVDWQRFAALVAPFRDRTVFFVDVAYPHFGSLFDMSCIRACDAAEVEKWGSRMESKRKLLSVFSTFKKLVYADATAIAAFTGYREAYVDQTDHFAVPFREFFKALLANVRSVDNIETNARISKRLLERLEGKSFEIDFIEGLKPSVRTGETILSVRIIIESPDPLLCPTELLVTWISEAEVALDWSKVEVAAGKLRHKPDLDPYWVIDYVRKLIAYGTLGNYRVTVVD